jgi:hypothetical protein
VREAVGELSSLGTIHGQPCNVAKPDELASLADFAKGKLGTIDLWIK